MCAVLSVCLSVCMYVCIDQDIPKAQKSFPVSLSRLSPNPRQRGLGIGASKPYACPSAVVTAGEACDWQTRERRQT